MKHILPDGSEIEYAVGVGKQKRIYWSDSWEKCWEWVKKGWVTVIHYGPGSYGHSEFFLN